MLEKAEYLRFRKRGTSCAQCGASLLETERHPSMLVEPDRESDLVGAEIGGPAESPPMEALPPDAPSDTRNPLKGKLRALPEAAAESSPEAGEAQISGVSGEDAEDSGFQRFDYCDKCWAEKKDKAFFCFWVGRRAPTDLPPKKLNRAERNLALLALFDSLSEKNNAENDYSPHLFFLAHLLMKFRIFKWQPSATDPETGEKMLCFLRADTQDPVLVPDSNLDDETIVQLKEEIESYLQESTGQAIRL